MKKKGHEHDIIACRRSWVRLITGDADVPLHPIKPALRNLFSSRLVKVVLSQSHWWTGAAGAAEAKVVLFAAAAVPVLELGTVPPLIFAMAEELWFSGSFLRKA